MSALPAGAGPALWVVPFGATSDAMVEWMCAAGREFVPHLSADAHTALHAVAGALAEDALADGRPPVTLQVAVGDNTLTLRVTDARDYLLRVTRPWSDAMAEAKTLCSRWEVTRVPGQRGSTLTAAIPIGPPQRRTPASRLRTWLRGAS